MTEDQMFVVEDAFVFKLFWDVLSGTLAPPWVYSVAEKIIEGWEDPQPSH